MGTRFRLQFTGHIVQIWHSIRIGQLIGLRLNEGMFVDRFRTYVGQSLRIGVFHDLDGDFGRTLSNRGQRRVEASLFEVAWLHQTGQFFGSIQEDFLWNGSGSGANHSQSNAGKDVGVVALSGIEGFALVGNRVEGRAG